MLRSTLARAVLAAGVASTGGICWAVKDVTACDVPDDSLLNYVSQTQKVWYTDCYTTPICRQSRIVSHAGAVDALCKAFFRSWPMKAELWLLSLSGSDSPTDDEIVRTQFAEEDSVSVFRVALRGPGEILFDSYQTFAFTWMSVYKDSDGYISEVKFGSALTGAGYRGVPLQTYMIYQALMPFHYLYSRVLLSQAAKQLTVDLA
eukprot:jgi/Ulvmu1/8765/UM048_0020.1